MQGQAFILINIFIEGKRSPGRICLIIPIYSESAALLLTPQWLPPGMVWEAEQVLEVEAAGGLWTEIPAAK